MGYWPSKLACILNVILQVGCKSFLGLRHILSLLYQNSCLTTYFENFSHKDIELEAILTAALRFRGYHRIHHRRTNAISGKRRGPDYCCRLCH